MEDSEKREKREQREKLISLLDTLKRNLAAVPKEILQTKYKKPYDELIKDISATATAYVSLTALPGIRIQSCYLSQIEQIVDSVCRQTGLLKQISRAVFSHQDINEVDALTQLLRQHIHKELEEYCTAHMGWYLAEECFADPPAQPIPYNALTDSILVNGIWKPLWQKDISSPEEKQKPA